MKMPLSGLIIGLSLVVSPLQAAGSAELTADYIDAFSGNSEARQLDALNKLQWSGLADPQLYDLVERNLLELYPRASSGDELDLASWYAKSLGTSGLDKYRTSLQGIVDSGANRKIQKYAQEGLDNLERYARWQPLMSSQENINPNKSHQVNVFANMLRSDDWDLRNMAAKRIYADHLHDPYLMDTLEAAIQATYHVDYSDKSQILTMAWMARALASAGHPKYRATLDEVALNAGSKKVSQYVKKYLKQHY